MSAQLPRRGLEVEEVGDVTVASFTVPTLLDEQSTRVIDEEVYRLVDELGRKKLLLSFGAIRDISSLALGKLVTLNKKVQAVGGKLVLCCIDPQIREVLAITRLERLFVIRGDRQEALRLF
jgi:anti-sigma B factor antagonist